MRFFLLFIVFSFCYKPLFSQVEPPFSFVSEDNNRLIKEEDSGKYYVASGDTSRIVFIGDETAAYKLFDRNHKILAEGNFSVDGDKYMREGKWTDYYENGAIKNTGYYHKDNPIGLWQHYYPDAKLKTLYTYALVDNGAYYYCMSGSYQEFYENGQLKTNGFYKATIDEKSKDTTEVIDPETEKTVRKITTGKRPRPEKYGTWEYFTDKGELSKKEEF